VQGERRSTQQARGSSEAQRLGLPKSLNTGNGKRACAASERVSFRYDECASKRPRDGSAVPRGCSLRVSLDLRVGVGCVLNVVAWWWRVCAGGGCIGVDDAGSCADFPFGVRQLLRAAAYAWRTLTRYERADTDAIRTRGHHNMKGSRSAPASRRSARPQGPR